MVGQAVDSLVCSYVRSKMNPWLLTALSLPDVLDIDSGVQVGFGEQRDAAKCECQLAGAIYCVLICLLLAAFCLSQPIPSSIHNRLIMSALDVTDPTQHEYAESYADPITCDDLFPPAVDGEYRVERMLDCYQPDVDE